MVRESRQGISRNLYFYYTHTYVYICVCVCVSARARFLSPFSTVELKEIFAPDHFQLFDTCI